MGWWGDFVARLLEKGVDLGYMRVFTHALKNHILNQVKKYNISIINNSLETSKTLLCNQSVNFFWHIAQNFMVNNCAKIRESCNFIPELKS
jgi:hypothetical protein